MEWKRLKGVIDELDDTINKCLGSLVLHSKYMFKGIEYDSYLYEFPNHIFLSIDEYYKRSIAIHLGNLYSVNGTYTNYYVSNSIDLFQLDSSGEHIIPEKYSNDIFYNCEKTIVFLNDYLEHYLSSYNDYLNNGFFQKESTRELKLIKKFNPTPIEENADIDVLIGSLQKKSNKDKNKKRINLYLKTKITIDLTNGLVEGLIEVSIIVLTLPVAILIDKLFPGNELDIEIIVFITMLIMLAIGLPIIAIVRLFKKRKNK